MMTETVKPRSSRRNFMKVAGLAGAGAIAMPQVSRAQTVTWKYQSTWPTKDIFHEFAGDFARRVNEMSGGRLKLDVLAAGAVVPAFQMQDAVAAGILDAGHGVCAYWYGKNKAFSLFGTPPSLGWDAHSFLAWMNYGGGYDLYNELVQQQLKLNLVGFLTGPMPCQPLGWFKKELKTADDFKGLKYRTVGLAADLMREMGAAVTILAGGEIVPALERGVIDGAEFNNPSSDSLLGFQDVAKVFMLQSYHQAAESFEIIFNKTKFDALSPELKAIVKYAAEFGLFRHVVEGARSLFQGSGDAAREGRQCGADAGSDPEVAARRLGQGPREALGRECLLQEGRGVAEGLGEALRRL